LGRLTILNDVGINRLIGLSWRGRGLRIVSANKKGVSGKCKCPRCGTCLMLKGGSKGEAKAKARLFLTMHVERTYICPKCD